MKHIYLLITLVLSSFIGYSQGTGEADWNYSEQSELNTFATHKYDTTCNSLILTSDCQGDFPALSANETLDVDCIYDLGGETITLPENVILEYLGGDIINGTLVFSEGEIDGRLLNSSLEIDGSATLISEEFKFVPERWEIVEIEDSNNPTPPSLEIAYKNHQIIQGTMDLVNNMEGSIFTIDKLDAFFDSMNGDTSYKAPLTGIINMPSDFHLKMSDNTYIRVFPVSGEYSSTALRIFEVNNVKVTGGNLIGDRLEHGPVIGGNVLAIVRGSKNIVVDGVSMSLSSSTGLTINSVSFLERPDDYVGSENVTIKNCRFESNRGNNLSLTDGQKVVIEGNYSYGAGMTMEGRYGASEGIQPKIGIILETQVMQYIEDVLVKDNVVEHTWIRSSILAVGSRKVVMTGNKADKFIGWTTAIEVEMTNNISGGITGGFGSDAVQFLGSNNIVHDNVVMDNEGSGVFLTNQDIQFYDNDIINCKVGMQLSALTNADIHDNNIVSNVEGAIGIIGQNYLDDVNVYENDFALEDGKPLNLVTINTEAGHENSQFTFTNNKVNASLNGLMPGSSNITISGNEFNGAGLSVGNAKNIIIKDNIIKNKGDFSTFSISGSNEDIEVTGNTFEGMNDGPFSTAVTMSSPGSTIIFHDNTVRSLGINYGMNVTGADGVSIQNNTIQNVSTFRSPLQFFGDNAEIINNTFINSNGFRGLTIEGDNNTVSGNQ